MQLALLILAAIGLVAVCRRLLRSIFRVAREGAYVVYAREIATTRARRGDLTGLEEAGEWVDHARNERLRALGGAGLWLALLTLPLLVLHQALPAYAAYSTIWLIPKEIPRRRDTRGGEATPSGEGP
jgi:hypothetical protein